MVKRRAPQFFPLKRLRVAVNVAVMNSSRGRSFAVLGPQIALVTSAAACGDYTCVDLANCTLPSKSDAGLPDADASLSAPEAASSPAECHDGIEGGNADAAVSTSQATAVLGSSETTVEASDVVGTSVPAHSNLSGQPSDDGASIEASLADAGGDHPPHCAGGFWSADTGACEAWKVCQPGSRVLTEGSESADRACAECPDGFYSEGQNEPECSSCSQCAWLPVVLECSPTTNTVCDGMDRITQVGTAGFERGAGVSVTAEGRVWVVGSTTRALEGTSAGGTDGFAIQYASDGSTFEVDQFGTLASDEASGATADANGNVWVVGTTEAFLDGDHQGESDVFLRRYTAERYITKSYQFGTAGLDVGRAVALSPVGDVWVTGYTSGGLIGSNAGGTDIFLRQFPANGSNPKSIQFGTVDDESAHGVALDVQGNVWVVGSTAGDSMEVLVLRYSSADSSAPDAYRFGASEYSTANGVAVDRVGDVWVVGVVSGVLEDSSAGGQDAFVRRYSPSGDVLATYQFGTTAADEATAVAADLHGNVWVAGFTSGSLGDRANAGSYDSFVRLYPADGSDPTTHQFGTDANDDLAFAVATDLVGNVWVAGHTTGDMGGANQGRDDVFVRQIALWQ